MTITISLAQMDILIGQVDENLAKARAMIAEAARCGSDMVILPEMMWGNYNLIMGVRRDVGLRTFATFTSDGGYNLDALDRSLQAAAAEKSKVAVLLNFPHNPTGYTVTENEAESIVAMLTRLAENGCPESKFWA